MSRPRPPTRCTTSVGRESDAYPPIGVAIAKSAWACASQRTRVRPERPSRQKACSTAESIVVASVGVVVGMLEELRDELHPVRWIGLLEPLE